MCTHGLISLYMFDDVCGSDWMQSTAVCLCSFISFDGLPVSGACGCGSWLGRRTSPGWVENRWPLVPRSTKGRSKGQSSEGTASRAWDEEAGLVRAGSKLIGPPWHCWGLYVCVFVCVCVCVCLGGVCVSVCVGKGKGGMWFRLRTLPWLGMLWHCWERKNETKKERNMVRSADCMNIINNFKDNHPFRNHSVTSVSITKSHQQEWLQSLQNSLQNLLHLQLIWLIGYIVQSMHSDSWTHITIKLWVV